MVGTLKKFNKEDHDEWDPKGKAAMLEYLNLKFSSKYKSIENPNQFGIDLLTLNENNEVIICWEIEVRYGNWRGDVSFPFDKVNCIERKMHQWMKSDDTFVSKIPFKLADDYKIYYVQLNRECNRAVVINSKIIADYEPVQWNNRFSSGEYVRQIPIDKTTQIKLSDI